MLFPPSTGSKILENGLLFKELLQTPNFRITVVDDADTVELCGALKVQLAVLNFYMTGEGRWGEGREYLPLKGCLCISLKYKKYIL